MVQQNVNTGEKVTTFLPTAAAAQRAESRAVKSIYSGGMRLYVQPSTGLDKCFIRGSSYESCSPLHSSTEAHSRLTLNRNYF